MGELREAARSARTRTGEDAGAHAAAYEVEIQKRLALAAACVLLALAGAATAIRFPHGGVGLVLGASGFVFTGYYLLIVTGESLADRQALSPLVAMWMANAFLLAVALILVGRPNRSGPRVAWRRWRSTEDEARSGILDRLGRASRILSPPRLGVPGSRASSPAPPP